MAPILNRLDRYLLARLLQFFGFFALVLVSVYWINRAVGLFDQLLADGQSAKVVLEFTALTLPFVIRVVMPIAGFAAAVQVTNRLSVDSEMVVMQSAGLSPWRLARAYLVFGLIGALLMGVLTHWLVPAARAHMADRQAEIAENVTAQFLMPGSFVYPTPGVTLYIRALSERGELLDLFIADARTPGRQVIHTAEKALLVRAEAGPKLIMLRGASQTLRDEAGGPRLSITRFDDFTYDLGAMVKRDRREARDLREIGTWAMLTDPAATLAATGERPETLRIEINERLSQPLQAPVAVLIGFAALMLGSFSRFGLTRQVLGAILALIVVQFLMNGASDLVRRQPELWPLIWLPPAIGGLMAAAMLHRAARDRRLPRQGAAA